MRTWLKKKIEVFVFLQKPMQPKENPHRIKEMI